MAPLSFAERVNLLGEFMDHRQIAAVLGVSVADVADVTLRGEQATATLPAQSGSGSGSAAQVFEVTDLLIPAGTDWSDPHVIDTRTFDKPPYMTVVGYLEVVEPPVDNFFLYWPGGGMELGPDGPPGSPRWGISSSAPGLGFLVGLNAFDSVSYEGQHPDPPSAQVMFATQGPTTTDITIVRARVTFVVI